VLLCLGLPRFDAHVCYTEHACSAHATTFELCYNPNH
jgi:hypothetical protein